MGDVTWQMRRQQVSLVVVFMPITTLFAVGTFLLHFISQIIFTLLAYNLVQLNRQLNDEQFNAFYNYGVANVFFAMFLIHMYLNMKTKV